MRVRRKEQCKISSLIHGLWFDVTPVFCVKYFFYTLPFQWVTKPRKSLIYSNLCDGSIYHIHDFLSLEYFSRFRPEKPATLQLYSFTAFCVETRKVLEECKMGLERFYDKKTEGIILRSRARWHEHGEKVTNIF